jgi:hypothetical protein
MGVIFAASLCSPRWELDPQADWRISIHGGVENTTPTPVPMRQSRTGLAHTSPSIGLRACHLEGWQRALGP